MAAARADLLAFLDDAFEAHQEDDSRSVREWLREFERQSRQLISGGALQSVSKSSASQTYAIGAGQLTATQIARIWRELIQFYDAVRRDLECGSDSVSEEDIYNEMVARLNVPATEQMIDFSCLRMI